MWIAKVVVTYKPGILDPEGKTIQNALTQLGFTDIQELETGKYFALQFDKEVDKQRAEELTRETCEKVLHNPVIQKYAYELIEVTA